MDMNNHKNRLKFKGIDEFISELGGNKKHSKGDTYYGTSITRAIESVEARGYWLTSWNFDMMKYATRNRGKCKLKQTAYIRWKPLKPPTCGNLRAAL
jgi:hypothetical protein